MDDKSRYIVGYGITDNKDQNAVYNVLKSSIEKYGPPLIFWTDNGKENINSYVNSLLIEYNIKHIKTRPRTPRQNGKIERFWPELEKRLNKDDTWDIIFAKIEDYINNYNNIIPHHGLPNIGKFHATPSEIFTSPHLQKSNIENCKILIDGKPIGLKKFAKTEEESTQGEIIEMIDISNPYSLLNRPVSF